MKCYEDCDCARISFDHKVARNPGFMLISHGYDVSKRKRGEVTTYYVSDYKHRNDLNFVLNVLSEEYNVPYEFFAADGIGLARFQDRPADSWNDILQLHRPLVMFGAGEQMLQNLIKKRRFS